MRQDSLLIDTLVPEDRTWCHCRGYNSTEPTEPSVKFLGVRKSDNGTDGFLGEREYLDEREYLQLPDAGEHLQNKEEIVM
jgi:hypothetical protein